jgi:hypothetical protein
LLSNAHLYRYIASYVVYVLYPNLYQCGPFMPFDAFTRGPIMSRGTSVEPIASQRVSAQPITSQRSSITPKPRSPSQPAAAKLSARADVAVETTPQPPTVQWRALVVAVAQIIAWCAASEAIMHFGYYPSAVFHGRHFFAKPAAAQAFKDSLQSFKVYAQTLVYITVTWATSHVVFAVPWWGLTKLNPVVTHPLQTPGFNPWSLQIDKLLTSE